MDKFFNYYKTKTNKNTKIKKYRNRNSGITLIALVVTIVVLLILAGISIGALTSDNGIINQTHDAKNDTYGDMIKLGIIDPFKVTRTALSTAVSVASTMLTTECVVAECIDNKNS